MLTEREHEVLQLLADGLTNQQIAERLFIAYSTVKWYNTQIYNKLGVNRREEALQRAYELDLVKVAHAVDSRLHNLPTPSTEFIGRDLEIAHISHLLQDPEIRLVTILAPGGMGKTRLALEVARRMSQRKDTHESLQTYFVTLAPVTVDRIIPAIAEQVGYQFIADDRDVRQQLFDYLRTKNILLLLDNFEHLLTAASLINQMLQESPYLKILVTSREILSLSCETIVTIGGMTYPELVLSQDTMGYSAVKLFVRSAQRVNSNFLSQTHDMEQIAQISRLVGGMPLAIILAATWVRTLSLQEIVSEIQHGLHLLEAELHDLPSRQHNIRSVFLQSWKMLNTRQQIAFARVSVFRGGCTRQAIQGVADVPLPTLKALVNKSLIDCSPNGRYTIHELLRQYAQEQLELLDEARGIEQNHSHYYLQALRQREDDLKGRRQLAAVNEIESDFENVRCAWLWAIEHDALADLSVSLEALTVFGLSGSRISEVCDLIFQVVEKFGSVDDVLAGRAFIRYHLLKSDYMDIVPQIEAYLKVMRKHDAPQDIACALRLLAFAKGSVQHQVERAVRLLQEALELHQQHGDKYGAAITLLNLGYWLTAAQNHLESVEIIHRSYEFSREIGVYYLQARAAAFLATILANRFGRFNESAQYYREADTLYRELNEVYSRPDVLINLAFWYYLLHQGDLNHATNLLDEAYSLASQSGHISTLSHAIVVRGLIVGIQQDYQEAKRLLTDGRQLAMDEKYKTLIADCGLALVHCGLGDLNEAMEYVKQVLTFFLPNFRYFVITIAACIRAYEGYLEDATALLAFLATGEINAKGWMQQWPNLVEIQTSLQTTLSQDSYLAACEHGKSLTMEQVVEQLLAD